MRGVQLDEQRIEAAHERRVHCDAPHSAVRGRGQCRKAATSSRSDCDRSAEGAVAAESPDFRQAGGKQCPERVGGCHRVADAAADILVAHEPPCRSVVGRKPLHQPAGLLAE